MTARWDRWFSDDNLSRDERILSAAPSRCAGEATSVFLAWGKRSVLDLACGVDRDTFSLERGGLAVVGLDMSLNGVKAARSTGIERGASSEFMVADARRLPFEDGSFAGVYCSGLLHGFRGERGEEDVRYVMDEIVRVLRDGGILILAVLSGEPEAGLPAVQLLDQQMFRKATRGLQAIETGQCDDTGCTGRTDYHVWRGAFQKRGVRDRS